MNVATGRHMRELEDHEWPFMPCLETTPLRVWTSNEYIAVLYRQNYDGKKRLTVNMLKKGRDGRHRDGITWDELQRIKNECLGDDVWCAEMYPAKSDVINNQNQRHLWLLDGEPDTRFPKERTVSDEDIEKALHVLIKTIMAKRQEAQHG